MVTVRFIRDDGQELFIDNQTWKIPNDGLVGFDYVEPSIQVDSKAFGDGAFYKGQRIVEKDRTIKAELMDASLNKSMRTIVRRFFGIKRKFKVYVNYDGIEKWCEGYVYAFSMPTENIYDRLKFTVTILSPNPYLFSVDEFGKNIAETIPMLAFPLISVIGEGFIFSEFKFAKEVILENDGDVETQAKIIIKAKGGVTNPVLKKGSYFLKINDRLEEKDEVVIDLVHEPPKITKNGLNIMGKLDRGSDIKNMCLQIGDNPISFDAEAGSNNMDVVIYYNKRYGGL